MRQLQQVFNKAGFEVPQTADGCIADDRQIEVGSCGHFEEVEILCGQKNMQCGFF